MVTENTVMLQTCHTRAPTFNLIQVGPFKGTWAVMPGQPSRLHTFSLLLLKYNKYYILISTKQLASTALLQRYT